MRIVYLNSDSPYIIGQQGETNAVTLRVDVTEWAADYPDGTGVILFTRPNKVVYPLETGTIVLDGKTYLQTIVTTKENQVPGWVVLQAQWYNGDVLVKSMLFSGKVLVSGDGTPVDPTETVPSWVTEWMDTLQEAIDGAALLIEAAETVTEDLEASQQAASDSEAWAKGTRSGEDVEPADETYHNNSKYYSEQIATAAEDVEAWANGTRGGVDIDSSDPAYHKNGKYYNVQTASNAASAAASASEAMSATPEGYTNVVASISPNYDGTKTYAVGAYCMNGGKLYRCTAAIHEPEAVFNSAHWAEVNVGGEVGDLKSALNAVVEEVPSPNIFSGYTVTGVINNTTGADNDGTEAYKRTDYIPVDASKGTLYIRRGTALWSMRLFYYDADKVLIPYSESSASHQVFISSNQNLTGTSNIPASAAYVRSYRDASVTCDVSLSYTYQDTIVSHDPKMRVADGMVDYDSLTDELGDMLTPFSGKTIAFLGDSIIGNFSDDTGVCAVLAKKTGATVINCAFGGSRMAYRYGSNVQYTYWNALSGVGLAGSIASGDWTAQETAVANITNGPRPYYFPDRLTDVKAVDWSKVDFILWEYGTNDFMTEVKLTDPEDTTNLYAFDNAYRTAIEAILTAYPNIRIIPITPIYRWYLLNGAFSDDSSTHEEADYAGVRTKLTDFVAMVQKIAREYQLPCVDDYYSLGANRMTRSAYFNIEGSAAPDATHPNAQGRERIAEHIARQAAVGLQAITEPEMPEIPDIHDPFGTSNLFNLADATLRKRMVSDGTISDQAQFIVSDWIDVADRRSDMITFSSAPNVIEIADESKSNLAYLTSKTTVNLAEYPTARYIRFSCSCTAAYTMIVTDGTPESTGYGYTIDKPIANLNVERQINKWASDHREDGVENILPGAAYTFYQCCGYRDDHMVKDSEYSIVMPSAAGENVDLRLVTPSAVNLVGVQKIVIKFYLENAANVSSMVFAITGTSSYTKNQTAGLVDGWNEVVCIPAQSETLTDSIWSSAANFRIYFTGSGAFTVTLSAIEMHRMAKAKLIFVDDHGYHGFKERAYPLLKAAGQPVTWAINPGRLGATIGNQESILSQADIDELAYDPYSEFSMHNWNPSGNPTETMTADELRQDYQKCITYLKKNGICPTHLWRAAMTQNRANNWWVAQDMVEAAASHTTGATYTTWPFNSPYNVPRYLIHGRSQADIDVFFDRLRLTHCTLVLYTHGCVVERDSGGSDDLHCTVAEIEYLCSKISEGVQAGWLEPTTYNRLRMMQEHGMYSMPDYE